MKAMTDAKLASAVAELTRLKMVGCYRYGDREWMRDLQFALADEFGRRHGWAVLTRVTKNMRPHVDRYFDADSARHLNMFEHPQLYYRHSYVSRPKRRLAAVIDHVCDWQPTRVEEYCRKVRLRYEVSDFPSWFDPLEARVVIYTTLEEEAVRYA